VKMPEGSQEPGYLQVEFQDGTLCDLTNTKRQTTVQIKCGVENKILSIVEDHSCHYVLIISVAALCRHEALGQKEEPSVTMSCTKIDL